MLILAPVFISGFGFIFLLLKWETEKNLKHPSSGEKTKEGETYDVESARGKTGIRQEKKEKKESKKWK